MLKTSKMVAGRRSGSRQVVAVRTHPGSAVWQAGRKCDRQVAGRQCGGTNGGENVQGSRQ